MKKVALLLIVSVLTFFSQNIYAVTLSDSSRITLLTCAPGGELYSAFGHTGIRVTDYQQQFDLVFNYGTFDFNQPNFYLNFIRGKMRYMLSVEDFRDFMVEYIQENRSVSEQELNLTPEDRRKVFDFLYTNALPENCQYNYDFFWDNCATRPRDVFEKVLGNRLQYHTDTADFKKDATLHDMLRLYTDNRPWVDFGFDLALGLNCEKIASPRNQTFLPDYLAKYEACASLDGKPFVTNPHLIIDAPPVKTGTVITPLFISFLLFFVIGGFIMLMESRKKKHNYIFDFILFFIAGLAGCALLSLWFFTVHYSTPKNLNLLWLIPTHVVAAFFLLKKHKPVWLRYYFIISVVSSMVLLIAAKLLYPHWQIGTFTFLYFLLYLRGLSIYRDLKPKPKENHIIVNKTARYYTLGELSKKTSSVWFLLHGHGHNAKNFLAAFKPLWNESKLFIAPEGLNRYYLKGFTGNVGVTWMTKEDRLNEIKDYIHYLDDLYEFLELEKFTGSITALGFSQGASTVTRWVDGTSSRVDNVIVYAGEVAPELLPLREQSNLRKTKNYFICGTKDEFFPPEIVSKMKENYDAMKFTEISFEGGHEVKLETLRNLV